MEIYTINNVHKEESNYIDGLSEDKIISTVFLQFDQFPLNGKCSLRLENPLLESSHSLPTQALHYQHSGESLSCSNPDNSFRKYEDICTLLSPFVHSNLFFRLKSDTSWQPWVSYSFLSFIFSLLLLLPFYLFNVDSFYSLIPWKLYFRPGGEKAEERTRLLTSKN